MREGFVSGWGLLTLGKRFKRTVRGLFTSNCNGSQFSGWELKCRGQGTCTSQELGCRDLGPSVPHAESRAQARGWPLLDALLRLPLCSAHCNFAKKWNRLKRNECVSEGRFYHCLSIPLLWGLHRDLCWWGNQAGPSPRSKSGQKKQRQSRQGKQGQLGGCWEFGDCQ